MERPQHGGGRAGVAGSHSAGGASGQRHPEDKGSLGASARAGHMGRGTRWWARPRPWVQRWVAAGMFLGSLPPTGTTRAHTPLGLGTEGRGLGAHGSSRGRGWPSAGAPFLGVGPRRILDIFGEVTVVEEGPQRSHAKPLRTWLG